MMDPQTLEQLFENGAMKYFETLFTNRDFQGILDMFGHHVTGFGTGIDELAYSSDDSIKLFQRDITAIPNAINYEFIHKKIVPITDEVAVFICNFSLSFDLSGETFAIDNTRQTLILSLKEGKVKIEHLHVSVPDKDHMEGESYPLGVIEDITKVIEAKVKEKTMTLMEAFKALEEAVVIDKVTQVYNRNRLDDLLLQELKRSSRYNKVFSLILVDLDQFKKINDTYGHLFGDQVLLDVASSIKSTLRETDYVGRWGGDELLIILPEVSNEDAVKLAGILRQSVEELPYKNEAQITVSLGVTSYCENDTTETIFERADRALYLAKAAGRNQAKDL